jgi:Ca2+-transporting ATPase
LRVAGLYRSHALKAALESQVPPLPGIHEARANVVTGSLLIHFDPALDLKRLVRRIEKRVRHLTEKLDDEPVESANNSATVVRTNGAAPHSEPWHALPATTVALKWRSSAKDGLSDRGAAQRLQG